MSTDRSFQLLNIVLGGGVFEYGAAPDFEKLMSYASLAEGWHGDEGVPISLEVIHVARQLMYQAYMANLGTDSDSFPGLNGELRVCFYASDEYHEFTVEPDLGVTYVHEKDGAEDARYEGLAIQEAQSLIAQHLFRAWSSFESSRENITTGGLSDFRALPSRPVSKEYQSLIPAASTREKSHRVLTSENFIQRSAEKIRYSSGSQMLTSPLECVS
ncbi:MAG TPA: hypothetical protein VFE31_08885 [Opitutaceae bacterium]|jgi:hypothetical protein|nr:hypothetical protein [Opitutaceae bacterium]